jgi:hypothetical protein
MKTSSFAIPSVNIQLGKRKQRSQMCEIFTDDGRIVQEEKVVLRGCCDDPDRNAAYLIDHNNQFKGEDGNSYQICAERSLTPICLRIKNDKKEEELKQLMKDIGRAAYRAAKRQQFLDAMKDTLLEKILWIVTIPCGTMLIYKLIQKIGN